MEETDSLTEAAALTDRKTKLGHWEGDVDYGNVVSGQVSLSLLEPVTEVPTPQEGDV